MTSRYSLRLTALLLAAACTSEPADDARDSDFITDGKADGAIAEGSPEATGVLAVANELDRAALQNDVGLSSRAALNITVYRSSPYQTLAELDGVPYVGPVSFAKLLAYAQDNGFVTASPLAIETISVPAGPFVFTTQWGVIDINGAPTQVRLPDQTPDLAAFELDKHEVTNAEYRECIAAGACVETERNFFSNGFFMVSEYQAAPQYANYPALWVTRAEAETFCEWRGGRLPTEQQWAKAARGGCEFSAPASCGREDVRRYPWASADNRYDYIDSAFAVYNTSMPKPVGSKSPRGDSPYGAQDIVGNVDEWVKADPNIGGVVYRGGSLFTGATTTHIDARGSSTLTDYTNTGVGFRCAY